jgi:hypothetical protein
MNTQLHTIDLDILSNIGADYESNWINFILED